MQQKSLTVFYLYSLSCSCIRMTFLWLKVSHSFFSSSPYMLAAQLPVRDSFHLVLFSCLSPASRAHFSLLRMRNEHCGERLIPQTAVSESSLELKNVCFLSHLMRLAESLQHGIPLVSQNKKWKTPLLTHTHFLYVWMTVSHACCFESWYGSSGRKLRGFSPSLLEWTEANGRMSN